MPPPRRAAVRPRRRPAWPAQVRPLAPGRSLPSIAVAASSRTAAVWSSTASAREISPASGSRGRDSCDATNATPPPIRASMKRVGDQRVRRRGDHRHVEPGDGRLRRQQRPGTEQDRDRGDQQDHDHDGRDGAGAEQRDHEIGGQHTAGDAQQDLHRAPDPLPAALAEHDERRSRGEEGLDVSECGGRHEPRDRRRGGGLQDVGAALAQSTPGRYGELGPGHGSAACHGGATAGALR